MVDIMFPLYFGSCVYIADNKALQGTLIETIKYARPTIFLGVPRIWEKVADVLNNKIKLSSGLKLRLLNWAQSIGKKEIPEILYGKSPSKKYYFANNLVFNKIKKEIGFDKCKIFLTGAAPLSKKIQEFFLGIGIPLLEAYAMSETSCLTTFN